MLVARRPSAAVFGRPLPSQDRCLSPGIHSVRADRSGYVFVRVEEDRIVWTRLSSELVNEGFALFEQRGMDPRRHRHYARRRRLGLLLPSPALRHRASPSRGNWQRRQCCFLDLGANLACRAFAAVRRPASSTLHLASIASSTASQKPCGRTSSSMMSFRVTQ